MRSLINRSILVLVVMLAALWSVYPPETSLRLGKDLSGGVTLVYAVQIGQNEDAGEVMDQLISVLKQRIDPQGVLNIQMVAQGRDRLEITMPLPSEAVKELRAQFEEELARFGSAVLEEDELLVVLDLEELQRTQELERLAGSDTDRLARLKTVAETYDAYNAANQAYEAIQAQGEPDPQALDEAVAAVASTKIAYEDARDAALAGQVSAEAIAEALRLSDQSPRKRDADTGEVVTLPSPREQALDRIRSGLSDESERALQDVISAYQEYESQRRTLDDPEDLKRLLSSSGVLEFRITVDPGAHPQEDELRRTFRERGPRNSKANDAAWFKLKRVEDWFDTLQQGRDMQADPPTYFSGRYGLVAEEWDGQYYILAYTSRGNKLTRAEGQWGIESAFVGRDDLGRPAVAFRMDARGAQKLGDLTGNHVGDQMAVVLDDEVYTAPNLRGRITRSGVIEGEFPPEELQFLIQTLNAGSLSAKLSPEPISENTVGPSLGFDQLRRGMHAGIVALIVVAAFMIVYYFPTCGGIAVLSLVCNAALILGVMSLNKAVFTLPGIAGVILTFGMAVDANVLIYERMREELRKGADIKASVRLGYQRALSSIVDGNVTNLIVCIVLYYTGTQEIKGFAITLGIGVLATLFSVLVIGRVLFDWLVDFIHIRKVSMAPMALPVIERILTPRVDWIGLRVIFPVISACAVGLGVAMIAIRGTDMLGIEFQGGTLVGLEFKRENPQDPDSPRVTLTRAEVADRVESIAEDPKYVDELSALSQAVSLPLNPEDDGVSSSNFEIRTTITQEQLSERGLLIEAITEAFSDVLDKSQQTHEFAQSEVESPRQAPVFPILEPRLEDNAPGTSVMDVSEYVGGVAIILRDITPPIPMSQLESRIESFREKPDFSRTLGRAHEVRVLEGVPGDATLVRSAVVLVVDDTISFFENEDLWWADVAGLEWRLASSALRTQPALASLQSFSAAIAQTFTAQAIVAVLLSFLLISIYIWVRFGSMRYSLAALACLMHDVLAVVGLVAVAELLWEMPSLRDPLAAAGILPFQIDLNMLAALLTIIGYSLNDTIIIMDRIRENRGKMPYASREAVNSAINSTISRTVITSGTTLLAVLILYFDGGEGVRSFAYALLCGVLVGTYSSVAVAAPLVWSRRADRTAGEDEEDPGVSGVSEA